MNLIELNARHDGRKWCQLIEEQDLMHILSETSGKRRRVFLKGLELLIEAVIDEARAKEGEDYGRL